MRTHLLQITGRFLLPLLLAGCQETPTDSRGDETVGESAGGPTMRSAKPDTASRTIHFEEDASFGEGFLLFRFDPQSGTSSTGFVRVFRGGTKTNAEAFLDYALSECFIGEFGEEECFDTEHGSGSVPLEAITVDTHNHLKISFNSANAPGFTVDIGAGGIIDVEFTRIPGPFLFRETGSGQFDHGPCSSHFQGTTTHYPALITGTVVGVRIPDVGQTARMGTTHNMRMIHTCSGL
jgi:hypothetical protein